VHEGNDADENDVFQDIGRHSIQCNFLWLGGSEVISGMTVGGYVNRIEPHHLVVERRTIRLPHLSSALDGFHIALMSDHHLFPGKTNFTLID
jgi:predicted MPP superfamily phosphohydrolase